MRLTLIAAVSALALTGLASTAVIAAPVAVVQDADYSDAQLQSFNDAMAQVRAASPTDGAPDNVATRGGQIAYNRRTDRCPAAAAAPARRRAGR